MFVGRDKELSALERRWSSQQFECVVVYGRRRVGKTTLINRFLEDRPTIFFSAIESSASKNLESLSRSIALYEKGSEAFETTPVYRSFESALEAVFALAAKQRIAFVIDEYPYLAKADRTINSVLQHAIDRHKDDSQLMMVLCGSSMSFMERQVLGYESPLYGRRTAQIKVEPFGYADVRKFLPRYSNEDAAIAYGLTDGIPQYLRQLDDGISIRDNIRWNILDPSCYLFEEPDNLLKQELRSPAEYNAVIQAIASGASRSNTIATACHMESSSCTTYLRNLIDLGIVRKETPFGEDAPRKTIYRIEDSFFRFWYRYVPNNMSLIQSGHADLAADRVMSTISDFMGQVFEDICVQWIWSHNGTEHCLSSCLMPDVGGASIRPPAVRRKLTSWLQEKNRKLSYSANANGAACHPVCSSWKCCAIAPDCCTPKPAITCCSPNQASTSTSPPARRKTVQ